MPFTYFCPLSAVSCCYRYNSSGI